jgi:hypothetical protein
MAELESRRVLDSTIVEVWDVACRRPQRAERTKDRETRIIPISSRLRAILQMRGTDPAGRPFPPSAHVFGDEVGQQVASVKRAWQTAVLKAHGHKPVWIWTKKKSLTGKGNTRTTATAISPT